MENPCDEDLADLDTFVTQDHPAGKSFFNSDKLLSSPAIHVVLRFIFNSCFTSKSKKERRCIRASYVGSEFGVKLTLKSEEKSI